MTESTSVAVDRGVTDVLRSLAEVHGVMDAHGLDRGIHHLVQLRASQMNRCGFCVEMHTREAREDGETSQRLDRVVVWDQVDDFDDREKAALAWTEALTLLESGADYGALRGRLASFFTPEEIGVLTCTVGMINLWNRMNIAKH